MPPSIPVDPAVPVTDIVTGSGPEPRRGLWSRYKRVATSPESLFAAGTILLTAVSWGIHLAGGRASIVAWIGTAGALVGGLPIAWGALRGLFARKMNVDELVTIAIAASLALGEYWGASLVAFMMLFGKVLEDFTAARAETAIEGLGKLVPAMARLKDPAARGGERTVPVGEVRIGDVVVIRPGERLPVDGIIVGGHAAVEEAAITGEPLPVEKGEGDEVFAGTLAAAGAIEIRTTRTGEATAMGRIAALVREAEKERAPIVRTADRWAKWFTPAVLTIAGLVYLWHREVLPAVAVLVVACPCALVLATPTAIIAGIARGAGRGILIKGGARLEAAGHIDTVCLDKTGTLTSGRPSVRSILILDDSSPAVAEHELLAFVAAAERLSEHPLARAMLAAAAERGVVVQNVDAQQAGFEATPGKGVRARVPRIGAAGPPMAPVDVLVGTPEFLQERGVAWSPAAQQGLDRLEGAGETPVAVALDGRLAGLLGLADAPREEASAAMAALRAAGVRKIVLLTGDREGPARAVARAMGISSEDVHSRLLPENKVEWVRRLRSEGRRVAMIGDGVNDAPALSAADVAIAMGVAGTDLALAAADILLMTDDLRQAAAAVLLSRKTLATIRQNLTFAVFWNAAAIGGVATGGFGLVAGALIHNLGSVAVVVNAARLLTAKLPDEKALRAGDRPGPP